MRDSPSLFLRGWDIVVLFALHGSVCAKQKRHALITRARARLGFKFVLDSLLWNRPFVRLTRFWSINRGYWSSCDSGGWFIYVQVPTELMACGLSLRCPSWKSYFLNSKWTRCAFLYDDLTIGSIEIFRFSTQHCSCKYTFFLKKKSLNLIVFVLIMSLLLSFNAVAALLNVMLWQHYVPVGCNHSIGNTSLTSRTHHWRRWSAAPLTSRCVQRLQLSPHQRGRRSGPRKYITHGN